MKLQQLKFAGGYVCPHFAVRKISKKNGCCGKTMGTDYAPVCTLIKGGGMCPGLANCPRLDIKTKGDLIRQWRSDLSSRSVIPHPKEV